MSTTVIGLRTLAMAVALSFHHESIINADAHTTNKPMIIHDNIIAIDYVHCKSNYARNGHFCILSYVEN